MRDVYELAGATGPGVRYTVPAFFDRATKTVVSNESSDIMRFLNTEFNALARQPELDFCPEALRAVIDETNSWVYDAINNGVYRCGFATSQAAYEEAFQALYAALERVEAILTKQRYIAGSQLTEADVRLFVTLIRYDEVYAVYFKTNGRLIRELPETFAWLRELYQMPAIKRSVNMQHIKFHYYSSHPTLNVHAIVPVGCTSVDLEAPHNRDRFG
jgi:putative glutathione S-transferase